MHRAGTVLAYFRCSAATDGFDASATFSYDARNRLTSHDLTGTVQWFSYDALGNLTGRDAPSAGATNQVYAHPTKPHAITAGPAGSYAYDADGNLSDRAGQALVWDSDNRLVCVDDDGSCADGTFDARYGYDLDGNRLWARLHDGQSETVVVQIEGLADWTRGSNDAQIHVVAFGRRVATKYLESAVALAAPSYVPGTKVPLEPGWLLFAVAFAGGLWLLVIGVRDGVPARMAERPAAATVVVLTSAMLVAPPPAWAGGGGGGGGGPQVYRRWLFHDHLGTNVLVTNVNGAVIRRRLFEPFGKLLNEQTSTEPHDRLFTGQRYEESTDLYDFQQRWYDAETGRFTGVDPVIQGPRDPQNMNAYGYVRNNPLQNVDPDGRYFVFNLGYLSIAIEEGRPHTIHTHTSLNIINVPSFGRGSLIPGSVAFMQVSAPPAGGGGLPDIGPRDGVRSSSPPVEDPVRQTLDLWIEVLKEERDSLEKLVEADESERERVLEDIEELDKGWPYSPGEPPRPGREDLSRRFGVAWDDDWIEDLVSERMKLMKRQDALEARIKLRRRRITELDSEIGFLKAVQF